MGINGGVNNALWVWILGLLYFFETLKNTGFWTLGMLRLAKHICARGFLTARGGAG